MSDDDETGASARHRQKPENRLPFNISYSIPEGQLRSRADDPDSMRQAVDWLVERASTCEEPVERAKMLGLAGACAVTLFDARRALELLNQAVTLADRYCSSRQQVTMRIRLADALAIDGRPDDAAAFLRPQLARCREDEPLATLEDFVHQHLGKAFIEIGDIEAALEHLGRAHELRTRKGDPDLLASTEHALQIAHGTHHARIRSKCGG